ncbi:DNA-binding response regulator [Pilimelia terevasa]|uniref:DNA-binding response regulator n=1 Tax=Pilimelia terevasa TaxID=53372 RepID=A0A8J3FFQ9_9ACTN|nr:response regulator transcription factor [Pilimelia terevasa]GGK21459.1 DNA-binding response regulator [Pilimelia terevasa]
MLSDLRVLVVDDHPVFRRGLGALLHLEPWVAQVAEASTVADALREATGCRPHVVAMDLALPDGDGIEAAGRLLKLVPGVRVLILTMTRDAGVAARALRTGVHGYVVKDADPDLVVEALRTVAAGGSVLGPGLGPALLTGPAGPPAPFDRLTSRERDILRRLAAGASNARIAHALGLSEKTVRNQLSAVFAKLGVADRVQAALLARDAGLADTAR